MSETNQAVEAPLQTPVRRAVAVGRWATILAVGVLLWMLGLAALDVPGDLPQWRHVLGASLLVVAVHLWRKA